MWKLEVPLAFCKYQPLMPPVPEKAQTATLGAHAQGNRALNALRLFQLRCDHS